MRAVVNAAEKGGVAVMGGASLDSNGVHVVRELLCELFVWFKGALEGKVAGEGGHHDFGGFMWSVVANRQAN